MRKFAGMALVALVTALSTSPAAGVEADVKSFCKANLAIDNAPDGPTNKHAREAA